MIRWLEDNPVGGVLAGAAGGLIVIALLLGVVWSLPPTGSGGEDGGDDDGVRPTVPELAEPVPIEQYAVVTERPVFNESRQPELVLDVDQEDLENVTEENVDAPEVELAGVVITPSLRMVTLRQTKEQGKSLVAFEGQPLEGNYGSWHVSRIEPREITLASGDGEEMQLKLEVHDAKIAPPPKPEPRQQAAAEQASGERASGEQGAGEAEDGEPMTRAEEIRQRIQERREELRRAAEEQAQSNEAEAANYRQAIQSMISGRKQQASEEDER